MAFEPRIRSSGWLKRGVWAGAAAGLAASGLVAAQPAPGNVPGPAPQPGASPAQTPPAAPEEAPPAVVIPPPPIVIAPIPVEPEAEPEPEPEPSEPAETPEAKALEPPPAKRARYDVAVLQALDKITAETMRFEAPVGRPVRYKNLVFTVNACERSTDEELTPDAIAHITIESHPRAAPGKPSPPPRQAFRGWMYAASPSLNPLEHPVYDAWVITCRAAAPS